MQTRDPHLLKRRIMGLKPVTFEFTIGGYPGPAFHLEVRKEQLHCSHYLKMGGVPVEASLSINGNEEWVDLLAFLATRKWKARYVHPTVVDGTGWDLSAKTEDFNIESSGSNVFPPGFAKFLRLLNKVTQEIGLEVH